MTPSAESAEAWASEWLDAVVAGGKTMSQRRVSSIEKFGGGLPALVSIAQRKGVHLLVLEDDHGAMLVAASLKPFRVLC